MKYKKYLHKNMPFVKWAARYPQLAAALERQQPDVYKDLISNPLYVVRMSHKGVEIGYKEDPWQI